MPELTYRSGSSVIEMYIEEVTDSFPRVYSGTGRSNITEEIQGNEVAEVGAPMYFPISDGSVIQIKTASTGGSLKFSYRVNGVKYPWWE